MVIRMSDFRIYKFLVLVEREGSIAGKWLAHVPEIGWVTMGDSVADAVDMAREGLGEIVVGDLNVGRDPNARTPATEYLQRCWEIMKTGTMVPIDDMDQAEFQQYLFHVTVPAFRQVTPPATEPAQDPVSMFLKVAC